MSKDEKALDSSKNGNVPVAVELRDDPQKFERLVSEYFGTPGDPKNKPVGRKEVFYYGLGVKANDLELVYSKQAPTLEDYKKLPKYYKDDNGNTKEYNDAQELRDIAKQRTELNKEIGKYASNNYSIEAKTQIEEIFLGLRFASKSIAKEAFDTAVETTTDAILSKPEVKNSVYAVINCGNSYQSALNNSKLELEKYKEVAAILSDPKNIVSYSTVRDYSSDAPTPQDLDKAVLRAIMDYKSITGLDPADKDFVVNLNQLDATKLGKIEVGFKDGNDLITYEINPKNFVDILKKVDPDLLKRTDRATMKSDEFNVAQKAVESSLKGIDLHDKKLISPVKDVSDKTKTQSRFNKIKSFVNKRASLSKGKESKNEGIPTPNSPITSAQNTGVKTEETVSPSSFTKVTSSGDKIVFPEEAKTILANKERLKNRETEAAHHRPHLTPKQVINSNTVSTIPATTIKIPEEVKGKPTLQHTERSMDLTKNTAKNMPDPKTDPKQSISSTYHKETSISGTNIKISAYERKPLLRRGNVKNQSEMSQTSQTTTKGQFSHEIGETKGFSFPKGPQTVTTKIFEESKERPTLKRTEKSRDLAKDMTKNTPDLTVENQKVEGPRTRQGFKPLPPTPVKKVPPPIPPKSALATKLAQDSKLKAAQETLRKDGMTLKPGEKITKPSTNNAKVGMHRTPHQKKNDSLTP